LLAYLLTYSTQVRAFLQQPMEGVVLQTYGHGNWPTTLSGMMETLRGACDSGLVVINTTQCARGTVLPIYAVGRELQQLGVVAGHDMTVEGALMKLSYILSKDEWSLSEKRAVCIALIIITHAHGTHTYTLTRLTALFPGLPG